MVQRFCSAESAFLIACRLLEEDRADAIVTGGVDELIPAMLQAFRSAGQLRGYARGFGEGAGLLVLERRDRAVKRGAPIRAAVDGVRTIGRLVPGAEQEGAALLLPDGQSAGLVGLSGTAASDTRLIDRLPPGARLEIGPLLGRSLAMGGLAMTALVLLLRGRNGLHVGASPEGPLYAIDFSGGGDVRS